jgi:hypothetical protein
MKNVVRSLRTVSIVCGVLFLLPTTNVALADAKGVVAEILDEALPQLQNTMASVSQGCSGGSKSRIGDSASVQAVTRVNAEQSSKRTMRRPTRQPFRGRLIRLGEAERRVRPAAAPG